MTTTQSEAESEPQGIAVPMPLVDPGLSDSPLRGLSEDEIERYEQDGAAIIRGIIPADWIAFMQKAVEDVLSAPKGLGLEYGEGGGGRFFGDLFTWLWQPDFRSLVHFSPLAQIAGQAMRSRKVHFFYDQLLVKEPGTPDRTPWHQDLPYWPVKGTDIMSIWMPLDTVTRESGSVIYIRGSHKWKKWYQPENFKKDIETVIDPDAEKIPDFDMDSPSHEFLWWDLEPGDCILHHPLTVHSAPGNASKTLRRRALATRWTGDDACYDPRPSTFMDLPALKPLIPETGLAPGDPMGGPLFPQIWP